MVESDRRMQRAQRAPTTSDVVILCGGPGTRLGSLTTNTPKSLLPVAGQPFLLYLLLHLQQQGFTRVLLAVRYLASQFRTFLAEYQSRVPNTALQLMVEPQPLGTGGALRYAARDVQTETFIAINGDTWVSQPIAPVLEDHRQQGRDCTVVAIQASRVEGGARLKGVWTAPSSASGLSFETPDTVTEGWVNAGLYVFERALVRSWSSGRYSLEQQFPMLLKGAKAGIFRSAATLLDIGTPECYARAQHLMESTMIVPASAP